MLDEDLGQAQLAQLEEFLDLDVDFVLSWAENSHTHTIRELKQEDFSRRRRGEIHEGPGLTSSFLSQI